MALAICEFISILLRPVRRFAALHARQHKHQYLLALDEHTMKDIGLNRIDVVA